MGYPMTYSRIVNRNGLADGNYDVTPDRHRKRVETVNVGEMSPEDFSKAQHYPMATRLAEYEKAFRLIAGDLRRLEQDAVDEVSIAQQIHLRTGIDGDTIAAVLREFFCV